MKTSEVNVLKHVFFFTIFASSTLAIFFILIIPSYRELKLQNIDLKEHKTLLNSTLGTQAEYQNELKTLVTKNKHTIDAFEHPFNIEEFKTMGSKYFTSLELTLQKEEPYEEDYIRQIYHVNATASSPSQFLAFIEMIKKSNNVFLINNPIRFEKNENKEEVVVEFNLSVIYINKKSAPPKAEHQPLEG